jgi:hypothetical protein
MNGPASKLLIAACFCAIAIAPLKGQSMIDLTKEEVLAMMQAHHKEYRRDRSIVNQQFNYLKYVNGMETRTWILYFTDEDICKSTKLVCDYGQYDEVIDQLNDLYEKVAESEWIYMGKKDSIQVTLARLEWYFTVREARK